MKLLLTSPAFGNPHMEPLIQFARQAADQVVLNPYGRTMTIEELKELWADADAIVAGLEPYTPEVLAQAPGTLKAICRFGVGYDSVDLAAAKARGISVTNTPGTNSDAVADLAIGMMIAIARHIPQGDKSVRDGTWNRYTGLSLEGKKLGILGLGAIGKGVAKRAAGFSMEIYAYDPYFDSEFAARHGVTPATLDEIFTQCDYITLHLPVLPETIEIVNKKTLEQMKPTAYLINAARGPLVNESDLYEALKNRRIMGAALDVYSEEPLKDSPLFQLDNIVVLPHIGGNTREAAAAMGRLAIENALSILKTGDCKHIVNR